MSRKHLSMNIKGKETLYKINLKQTAEKDLDKINEPYISSIISAIEQLSSNPRNEKVKKLVGKENEYRLRKGNYRILFYINEDEKLVIIARVLHRKDAYRL